MHSSLKHPNIVIPDKKEENIHNNESLRLTLQLRLSCTQYCLPLTSDSWNLKVADPLNLYKPPKYDTLDQNIFWGLQVNIWQWYLGGWHQPLPQGLGQGNGESPDIWAIVSAPLLNWIKNMVHGEAFKCCLSRETIRLVRHCFVGDSNIIQVALSPNTPTE